MRAAVHRTAVLAICTLVGASGCQTSDLGLPIAEDPGGIPTLGGDAACVSGVGRWSASVVDTPGTVESAFGRIGPSTSLDFAHGTAAVAYSAVHDRNSLRLATEVTSSTWASQSFSDFGQQVDAGFDAVVRVDSAGRPIIAVVNRTAYPATVEVRLADGSVAAINLDGALASNVALALDARDRPHVVYGRSDTGLTYAAWDGTSFRVEPVQDGNIAEAALALDRDGNPATAFALQQQLRFGHRNADGSWATEVIDRSSVGLGWPSLALDALGLPHVAYVDRATWTLKYAIRRDAGWQIETVGCAHEAASASMVLDGANQPHVAFAARSEVDAAGAIEVVHAPLQYAVRDARRWTIEPVGADLESDGHPSLVIGPDGVARVSWVDLESGTVRYGERP